MTARLGVHHDVLTRGSGRHGVLFVRFVLSSSPGGYSAVEIADLFETRAERDAHLRDLRRMYRPSRKHGPIVQAFEVPN